ncbi:hypothetical protein FB451DRAFT_1408437 [Mycena latifolia]|nr:hypothetical protein FB451DRAFT_1408437 [Mycena latifolia]
MSGTFTTILNMRNAVGSAAAPNMGASTQVKDARRDGPQCCHCGVRGGSHAPTCPFSRHHPTCWSQFRMLSFPQIPFLDSVCHDSFTLLIALNSAF